MNNTKKCLTCKQMLDFELFQGLGKSYPSCKPCRIAYMQRINEQPAKKCQSCQEMHGIEDYKKVYEDEEGNSKEYITRFCKDCRKSYGKSRK